MLPILLFGAALGILYENRQQLLPPDLEAREIMKEKWRRLGEGEWDTLQGLIVSALPLVDTVVDGKRYLGSESEVVANFWSGGRIKEYINQDGSPHYMDPVYTHRSVEQLCRTKRGAWFLFDPASSKVTPCDEQTARMRLTQKPAIYSKVFGAPEVA